MCRPGGCCSNWSALAHVPITDSYALPLFGNSPWDFFHINSISLAGGSLLISARHMWALYDINPKVGDVNWTLGGKQSTFSVAPDATFACAARTRVHPLERDPALRRRSRVPYPPAASQSRALWIRLDYATHTVSLVKQIIQPASQPESTAQGSVQTLPDGDVIVGWGSAGTFSEYNSAGQQLLQGTLPPPDGTTTLPTGQVVPNSWSAYRGSKSNGTGPSNATGRSGAEQLTRPLDGLGRLERSQPDRKLGRARRTEPAAANPVATAPWNGLITPISITGSNINYVRVVALSNTGRELGISQPVLLGS